MLADGHVLVILHAAPRADQDQREGRFFWRKPDGTWSSTLGGGLGAIRTHLGEYEQRIDALQEAEKAAATASAYFDVINQALPLARSTRNMHAALQEARGSVEGAKDLISLRDDAYRLEREADILLNDAKNGLDFLMAQKTELLADQSHQMSLAGHRLNTLVALFFPTATLAALLGMNVPHGLENVAAPYTFIAVLVVGLVLGFIVRGMIAGKRS
jgi:Mg2+ and Co2+ transporter CorA